MGADRVCMLRLGGTHATPGMALKSGLLGAWSHYNALVAAAVYGAGNAFLQGEKRNLSGLVADVARCSLVGAYEGLVNGQRHIDRLLACNQTSLDNEAAKGRVSAFLYCLKIVDGTHQVCRTAKGQVLKRYSKETAWRLAFIPIKPGSQSLETVF